MHHIEDRILACAGLNLSPRALALYLKLCDLWARNQSRPFEISYAALGSMISVRDGQRAGNSNMVAAARELVEFRLVSREQAPVINGDFAGRPYRWTILPVKLEPVECAWEYAEDAAYHAQNLGRTHPEHLAFFFRLCHDANEHGQVWGSQRALAKRYGINRRTLVAYVQALSAPELRWISLPACGVIEIQLGRPVRRKRTGDVAGDIHCIKTAYDVCCAAAVQRGVDVSALPEEYRSGVVEQIARLETEGYSTSVIETALSYFCERRAEPRDETRRRDILRRNPPTTFYRWVVNGQKALHRPPGAQPNPVGATAHPLPVGVRVGRMLQRCGDLNRSGEGGQANTILCEEVRPLLGELAAAEFDGDQDAAEVAVTMAFKRGLDDYAEWAEYHVSTDFLPSYTPSAPVSVSGPA